jgi:hypothetical protein
MSGLSDERREALAKALYLLRKSEEGMTQPSWWASLSDWRRERYLQQADALVSLLAEWPDRPCRHDEAEARMNALAKALRPFRFQSLRGGWSVRFRDLPDALAPLLAEWSAQDRAAGAAEVVARVEAVLTNWAAVIKRPAERAGYNGAAVLADLRAALRGPS